MDKARGPETVAIFMDGNRRWARARGLPLLAGYVAGKDVFAQFLDFYTEVRERWGTRNYIFYAFSTENWQRPAEQVESIMRVFDEAFDAFEDSLPRLIESGVRIRFVGARAQLSARLQARMVELERATAGGTEGSIALAMPYGGRDDILQAVRALIHDGAAVTAHELEARLWTRGIPEPDLIIRPGGEMRLSNFLSWQSAYSELAFSPTLWPDFTQAELEAILAEYASRERRRGA